MKSKEIERVYFAVVDTYDDLTGEPILEQREMLLDEDTYHKFSDNDDSDPVFINWSELYEVVRLEDNVYMLVNYTTMDGVEHKNVFSRFKTNTVGPVEEFVEWLD